MNRKNEEIMIQQNEENEKIFIKKLAERVTPPVINPIYNPRYREVFDPTIRVDGPIEEFKPEWSLWTAELMRH